MVIRCTDANADIVVLGKEDKDGRHGEHEPSSFLVHATGTVGDLLVCVSAHGVSGLLLDEVESCFKHGISTRA